MFMLALTLATASAAASPNAELLRLANESHKPGITFSETNAGWSLSACRMKYVRIEGADPITKNQRSIRLKVYAAKNSRKTVLILPPTGGENLLDQGYANTICFSGVNAVILQSWDFDTESTIDMGMHDRGALRALSAVRHSLDYLETQGQQSFGILGTSVGALSAGLVLGYEARLVAGALITGGDRMHEIIAVTIEQGAAKLREARMKHFGFKSEADYAAALKQNVRFDPSTFIGLTGQKRVFSVIATEDLTVPTRNQYDLHRAFGSQELREIKADHVEGIKGAFWKFRGDISDFFTRSL